VFVTHDQAEALAMADRIAVMDSGRIQQIGTPTEVFRRPLTTFVASFIGSTQMNLLPVVHHRGAARFGETLLPVPPEVQDLLTEGQEAQYGIRPEYLRCSAEPLENAVCGEVTVVESLGHAHLVTLETGDGEVQAVVPEDHEPAPGARMWAAPRPDRVLVYRDGDLVRPAAADESSVRIPA
jgi:multiple sugar transport system ATP-binding protein